MADIETTVSPVPAVLVHAGLKLGNAARGVVYDTSASISGAVTTLDFAGEPIKRFTVTGALSGSFTFPPLNMPTLDADNQSIILTVVFFQDGTGGHAILLETLFANADVLLGTALVDDTANGVTSVDIVARRAAGVTTYAVYFSESFDAGQIETGTMSGARLPTATSVTPGIVTLAAGSGAAAAGNHTHPVPVPARITIRMSDGSILTNADYDLLDMPTSGTVLRLSGLRFYGTGTPTGTVTAKISGTQVTGTGTSVSETPSTDSNASAANTFVARQILQINIAAITGTPTLLTGYLHYTLNTSAWSP